MVGGVSRGTGERSGLVRGVGRSGSLVVVSNAAQHHDRPHGTGLLPRDLTAEELAAGPVIDDLDALLIDDLTDDEYAKFLAALSS